MNDHEAVKRPRISDRQREVLELVAAGHSNKEIGARCGVSEQTVKRHVSALLVAFGVANRTALTRRALALGFVEAVTLIVSRLATAAAV